MPNAAQLVQAAQLIFWQRCLRWTVGLLLVWLAVNLALPWFARDLDKVHGFGFPAGYWLAAVGTLMLYLLIIVVYVVVMDRLEAAHLRALEQAHAGLGPERG